MKKSLIALLLALSMTRVLADVKVTGPDGDSLTLTKAPCELVNAETVFASQGIPGEAQGALLIHKSKPYKACWVLHLIPQPHVDVLDESGDFFSVPVEAFSEASFL